MHLNSALKRSARYVRKIVIVAVLVMLLALPPFVDSVVKLVYAGTPSPAKLLINNSQAGATGVTYTVNFTATASTQIQRLTVQFCQESAPTGTCTTPTGMDTTGASFVSSNVSGSSPSHTFTGNGTLQTDWGTPTTQSPLTVTYAVTGITNPSTANTTSYARLTTYSDAGSTTVDSVAIAFAVLDTGSIAVSATVDPNFTFTIARAVTGAVDGGSGEAINVSSTADASIPFGSLNTTTASVAAHDITITTNASNGYQVTASTSATPPLTSTGGDDIDAFTGTNASPTSWSSPNGSTANTNTGFFGYTTNDSSLCTGTANRFTNGGPNYAGFSTTGAEVACSSTPVSSETTRLGWKLEINDIQPAGGYTGTIILIATPTY